MDYPFDKPDFSPFMRATLAMLRKAPLFEQPVAFFLEPINDALDPAASALLHTLAHHTRPRTGFAWRALVSRYDDDDANDQFERIGEWEAYNVSDASNAFDPEKGFRLGESAGGEVTFGFHWDGGALRFFEVDGEDELGDPIKVFESADDFWNHILDSEYGFAEMEGEEAPEFLVGLWEIAGAEFAWPE